MARTLVSTTALALVLPCSAAFADVTPEQVWESWQAIATAAGQDLVVGTSARNGEALEVSEVVMTFSDELGGSFSATIDKMTFVDNGDGTVGVTVSEAIPISLAFPQTEDGPSSIKLTVRQPGTVITASGTPEATSYSTTAPSVVVALDEVKDETGAVLDTKGQIELTEVASTYTTSPDGAKTGLEGAFTAKSLAMTVSGSGADGAGSASFNVTLTDLAGTSAGMLLGAESMANLATALNEGFSTDTSLTYGSLSVDIDVTDEAGPMKLTGTTAGGGLTVQMNKDRLVYGTSVKSANFAVSGAEIPFPEVVVTFAEYGFDLKMPVTKSEAAQDFGFMTKIIDLTVSEDVWGLFDPAGVLSRDPASFVIDVKGKGFWTQDIMDPEVQMDGTEPPGQLDSLDLTQLLLKAAGVEVGATGGLTFDNSDLVTFDGMPAPSGSINVTIKGVNKLVDNLIAMGLLPEEEAMGFRMMLGMFTRPGAGPDEVTSVIEFRDGGLFANGQQLQ